MKIPFICKYNRFRSKIAEAYFNKINKNNNPKAPFNKKDAKKVIVWNIKDVPEYDDQKIKKTTNLITKKVIKLVEEIK